jgi:hypothetical protein
MRPMGLAPSGARRCSLRPPRELRGAAAARRNAIRSAGRFSRNRPRRGRVSFKGLSAGLHPGLMLARPSPAGQFVINCWQYVSAAGWSPTAGPRTTCLSTCTALALVSAGARGCARPTPRVRRSYCSPRATRWAPLNAKRSWSWLSLWTSGQREERCPHAHSDPRRWASRSSRSLSAT